MMKSAIVTLVALFGIHAGAATPFETQISALAQDVSNPVDAAAMIDWKIGDTTDYSLKGGVISGKMHVLVREDEGDGVWVQQDMDLGFMGKQKVEILYDRNTGKVLQLIVNGNKQNPPDQSEMEIVEQKNETITVPKGTFDCIYVKILNKKDKSTSEVWLNPYLVPISGMVKTVSPSQMGTITVELTNFNKQ